MKTKWIAPKEYLPYDEIRTVYYKAVFDLSQTSPFVIDISAHSRYKMYINGNFVCAGPCRGDAYNWYFDTVDISSFLEQGKNCITVAVTAYPAAKNPNKVNHKGPDWSMDRPLPPSLYVLCRTNNSPDISTGVFPWHVKTDHSITPHIEWRSLWLGAMETVDGKKAISDSEKFFDNVCDSQSQWDETITILPTEVNKYGIIPAIMPKERPIPMQTLTKGSFMEQGGMTIPKNTTVKKIYSVDAEITAFFKIKTLGGKGSEIKITYAECFYKDNKGAKGVRDDQNGVFDGHSDFFYPKGENIESNEEEIYEPFLFRTFRFIQIEATTKDEELMIFPPEYIITHYPIEVKTMPENGEPWIKKIWEMSLQTLKNCVHESFEDCPYYEQMQYTMDTRLQGLFIYYTSGDTQLLRKAILDYRASLMPNGLLQSRYPCNDPQIIPQFALHWIFMVNDYYSFTGDLEFVELCRPAAESLLSYFRSKKANGLVANLEYWNMVDWAPEWSKDAGTPPSCKEGANTFHNMIYAYALKVTASLMGILELPDLEKRYISEADSIHKALFEQCYDKEAGLFREGPNSSEITQHSQIFAVIGGYGDTEFRKNLMQKVYDRNDLVECTFPLLYYLFRGFEEAGLYALTEKYWDLWKGMIDLHLSTIPEEPYAPRSDCHAWGALMLYEFPRKILGVTENIPKSDFFTVEPKALYIKEISGTTAIGDGEVYVAYKSEGGKFMITIENRSQLRGRVIMPDGSETEIPAGGKVIENCAVKCD